jgi:glycosyltransferase involved in cell wall biosynthesis
MSSAHDAVILSADIVIAHKATPATLRASAVAKTAGIPVVYDTDDYDNAAFAHFYPAYLASGVLDNQKWFLENADGFTVASTPLAEHWPGAVIENGFDATLKQFQPRVSEYPGSIKVAWGGSSTHGRDFEMWLKLGFLDAILNEYPVDMHVYGLQKAPARRKHESGNLLFYPQHPRGIEWYIHDYFANADFLVAPLVQDEFNDHRSTLKLVEAGIAGKTIIASSFASYRSYGAGCIRLTENTAEDWYDAFVEMITDTERRDQMAERNLDYVTQNYSAETLTQQRIEYYQELINV